EIKSLLVKRGCVRLLPFLVVEVSKIVADARQFKLELRPLRKLAQQLLIDLKSLPVGLFCFPIAPRGLKKNAKIAVIRGQQAPSIFRAWSFICLCFACSRRVSTFTYELRERPNSLAVSPFCLLGLAELLLNITDTFLGLADLEADARCVSFR